jgi:hypothetical protein
MSHDAAAKKANRERLTPAFPFAVIPGVRIPATLMAYGAEAGGIVTAIPVLQDWLCAPGQEAAITAAYAGGTPSPDLASRNLGLSVSGSCQWRDDRVARSLPGSHCVIRGTE